VAPETVCIAVAGSSDVAEQRQTDLEERALLYVALTRARERALVLSHGEPSPYLANAGP